MEYVFDFEQLEVCQLAVRHAVRVFEITEQFPHRVQSSLGDQLGRSSVSVANNIAERLELGENVGRLCSMLTRLEQSVSRTN